MRLFGRTWTFRDLLTSPLGLGALLVAGVGGYYLWNNHQEHVLAVLPYSAVGLCLVMHLFMHGGHGGNRNSHQDHRH